MKKSTMWGIMIVVALVAVVGIAWGFGLFKGFGTQNIVPQQPNVTNPQGNQPGNPENPSYNTCDSSTSPKILLVAQEEYPPISNIANGQIDLNIFDATTNAVLGSSFNGPSASYGVSVPQNSNVYALLSRDVGSSDYYGVKIDTFNVDCQALPTLQQKLAREGTLTQYFENQSPNSSGNKVNGATNVADINGANTEYTFTWVPQETTSQASFGAPASTKKVNVVMDYNSAAFQQFTVNWNGNTYSDGSGIAPRTVSLDTYSDAKATFTLPFLGLANSALLAPAATIKVKTSGSYSTTLDQNSAGATGYGCTGPCARIAVHESDYTIFFNTNTNMVEEGVFNPTTGTDLGATDLTTYIYYK